MQNLEILKERNWEIIVPPIITTSVVNHAKKLPTHGTGKSWGDFLSQNFAKTLHTFDMKSKFVQSCDDDMFNFNCIWHCSV